KRRRRTISTTSAIKGKPEISQHSFKFLKILGENSSAEKILVQVLDRGSSTDLFNECSLFLFFLSCNVFLNTLMWVVVIKKGTEARIRGLSEHFFTYPCVRRFKSSSQSFAQAFL
ncbi:hypothetical protein KSS87_005026, partial [Heliosperma pusillum]